MNKKVTPEDVQNHRESGPWRELERLAHLTNSQAEQVAHAPFRPVLGGGTRLMLAMEHRLSDDVDLFIHDPQWIGYLTPRLNDSIEAYVRDYSEGATSLKLELAQGEIDYIVSTSLLGLPNEKSPDSMFELEPVAEVLAKKLFYRGHLLAPRDLFDWRMIEMHMPASDLHLDKLAKVLKDKLPGIRKALDALSQTPADNPRWAGIRTPYPLDLQETVEWAKGRVEYLQTLVAEKNASQSQDQQVSPPPADDFPAP